MMSKSSVFYLFLVFLQFVFFGAAVAEEAPVQKNNSRVIGLPETLKIDGVDYQRERFLKQFLSAITTGVTVDGYIGLPSFDREEYPWAYMHVYPENGLPKLLAVNKWMEPIKISFGMPNDMKPFVLDEKSQKERSNYAKSSKEKMKAYSVFPIVEQEIKNIAEAISEQLPINISYLEDETKERYGNLRVNLYEESDYLSDYVSDIEFRSHYKRDYQMKTGKFVFGSAPFARRISIDGWEKKFKARHIFTKGKKNKNVYGYFLSNQENEITFAVCHIWKGHPVPIIKGLVRECVIRALGVPDYFSTNASERLSFKSFLTAWNHEKVLSTFSEFFDAPFVISELDGLVLSVLYNKELHVGMTYTEFNKKYLNK